MLLFKRKFLDAIRQGSKTQTIRVWKQRMMRPGQRSYIPGAGYIQITAVDEVALLDLAVIDALPDGFSSADALRCEILELHPDRLAAGQRVFRIAFRLLCAAEQQQAILERSQRKKTMAKKTIVKRSVTERAAAQSNSPASNRPASGGD